MGFVLGRKPEHETYCVFLCQVTEAGDEGQLVCAAGAAGVVLTFFSLCRSVTVASSCFGCWVVWNLLLQIAVVIFCCHVRRHKRVCQVMLQNAMAACMLHGAGFGEEAGARNLLCFSVSSDSSRR